MIGIIRVAVLSGGNYTETAQWLRKLYNIDKWIASSKTCVDTEGKQYIIVANEEDVKGQYFSAYMKAPSFVTLEDKVRERIR